ncbi:MULTISPECIES: ATP-binding cassette domain-containing protein [unclassified Neorhizobium]|uniref:ATP-binding cassette domain-containing protein n=1 Tax=unclassified Neorhizobium TaxID=2629175 RepID=UPI001FF6AD2E|nr:MULTISPECIES: ATP-binding cassette domain-containing protein [unclassified Neorhizobium]MCJ9673570.1 ATP-binding cassette domain-containing protein [Neorhizobium sp. SHOUNA12B]MCJ9748789.1 ATP-binding cassette domain-containing protein [Neorhizobium sp. SHOUNA12A]
MTKYILQVEDLVCEYRLKRQRLFGPHPVLRAVGGVSLQIMPGQSLAVVGESGSGKSTLARTVMALETPTSGSVKLNGEDLFAMSSARLREVRRNLSMVFQDPYESLDPRLKIGVSVADPLDALHEARTSSERRTRIGEALEAVGLRAADAEKFPHEFSGGQRQRIAIARALITRPALIVADEPVSALDVSVQAQVLNLMHDLRERYGIAYLFVSHNLAVVRQVADEVAVMQCGVFVEKGKAADVFAKPQHDYTRKLLAAVLKPEAMRRAQPPLRAIPN